MENKMLLPTDSQTRKGIPIGTGVVDYFPLALAEVAKCSKQGNDQHNPGQSLHWDKTKSTDHADCLLRHFIDRGKTDSTGIRESARMAWRALALLQIEIENEKKELEFFDEAPQVESQEKQDDGWIPWNGGECPVDPETRVFYQLRAENISTIKRHARDYPESHSYAANFRWTHEDSVSDIVAYKVVK